VAVDAELRVRQAIGQQEQCEESIVVVVVEVEVVVVVVMVVEEEEEKPSEHENVVEGRIEIVVVVVGVGVEHRQHQQGKLVEKGECGGVVVVVVVVVLEKVDLVVAVVVVVICYLDDCQSHSDPCHLCVVLVVGLIWQSERETCYCGGVFVLRDEPCLKSLYRDVQAYDDSLLWMWWWSCRCGVSWIGM